ncbi:MAG: hypothetical protein AB9907_16145 [Flexilinea sp.]
MKKNPLVIFGIIGIVAGFILGRVIKGADQNQMLTYGLIGGLVVGFLLDTRKKPSSIDSASSPSESPKIPSIDEITDKVEEVTSDKAQVSRVQDATDVIARAREEIAKNTGSSNDDASVLLEKKDE